MHSNASDAPRRLVLRRGGAPTGVGLAGCYAAALGDCQGTLSREHYLPECVMKLIAAEPVVQATGRPRISAGFGSLTARVLCQRHNESLSQLDELAVTFVEVLRSVHPGMPRSAYVPGDRLHRFHGDDIGRLVLKMLCAVESGGVWRPAHPAPRGWAPPESWLRILFEDARWPEGWGIHVPVMKGGDGGDAAAVTLERRIAEPGVLIGATLSVAGFPLILKMVDPPSGSDWGDARYSSVHGHPARVVMHTGDCERTFEFAWDRTRPNLTINHRFSTPIRPSDANLIGCPDLPAAALIGSALARAWLWTTKS